MQERLQNVFRKVFENESLMISTITSAKDIRMWDSMTHLQLIAAVEEEFKIKFTFNEVMEFETVGDMMKIVKLKLETRN